MNNVIKARIDSIVNGQILSFIEQSHFSVASLASSEPTIEVWEDNSYRLTRFIRKVEDDQMLVVFYVSRTILLGFANKVMERGLIFSKGGQVREATDSELLLRKS